MGEKITLNTCMGTGCHAGCIHETHVKNGRIIKLKPLIYPDNEKGIICIKGAAGARLPYHPDRLKYPLKRIGERGKGKWARITWEQALDEIADKIKEIRNKYGPASVAISPIWSSTNPIYGISSMLGLRLRNLLQASDLNLGVAIDSNSIFSNYFCFGTASGSFADPRTLIIGKTKYIITWGTNPAEMALRLMKYINQARKEGAKLVDIGIIFDDTAKQADWWIPVKAGSDTALALGMINIIIKQKLYDVEFIIKHTNSSFLVRIDSGRLIRENDINPSEDPKNYVIWDINSSKPKIIAPKSDIDSKLKPALFGTYKIKDFVCKPVFQLLADMVENFGLNDVEAITGVSLSNIERLSVEYATTKPAAIVHCFGLRYKNSGNAYRAMAILGALTGNIGIMGGGPIMGYNSQGGMNAPQLRFNDFPIIYPTDDRSQLVPAAISLQCIATAKPYPIKAIVIYGVNLLHTYPNPKRWKEQLFPNLDLIVVNDIFMTATAEYADYVLPDCTVFERDDIDLAYGGHILYLEKAIEPMYECRPPVYFWSELAKRLELGKYFDKTMDEWMEIRLNSSDPTIAGIKPPLTLERLKREKMVRVNIPDGIFHPFLDKKFLTPSGKIEFYREELVASGDALPVFREQMESPRSERVKRYPLVFNTANNKYFVHTLFANEPSILKLYKPEPHLSINPADAEKRGIKDGDIVKVYNDRGSFKVKALISNDVTTGVVHIPHGWWPKQFIEGHPSNLLLSLASPETRDEAREIFWELTAGKMGKKAFEIGDGWFAYDAWMSYSPDIIFDCLCEVTRV